MASVYKTISAKSNGQLADEEMRDLDLEEMLENNDETSDSDEDEDEDEDEEEDTLATASQPKSQSPYMPKTRVLMLSSRGITSRHRHLLNDLTSLLPHAHKESKLDTKKKTSGYNMMLNSMAELHSCNVIFFLEARKHGQDLYLWLARPPNGPTIKFSVNNLHTMEELRTGFSGNCLKGGRGIVVFDPSFDENVTMNGVDKASGGGTEYKALVREMLRGVFCVPRRGVRGMKPFVDRIIGIFGVDGKIWIRVYEIRESDGGEKKVEAEEGEAQKKDKKKKGGKDNMPDISLVEIGPRFVLTPIVILEGSFGGPVIYENREYVSPNQVRRETRLQKAGRYASRKDDLADRTDKRKTLGLGDEASRKKGVLDNRAIFS